MSYSCRSTNQFTLDLIYVITVTETDFSFNSRHILAFYVALSRSFSILGQLRLKTIHLVQGDIDDICMMKSNNFGKSTSHSSSASTTKHVLSRFGSCRMLTKISNKTTQAFTSSKSALPACSYFFHTWEIRDSCLSTSR